MTIPTERFRDFLLTVPDPVRREPPLDHVPIDLRPASAFEAITRQMVESLSAELREIKSRLNGLIFMMVGAILLEIVSRLLAT
ncbi:hypothetical protein BH24CHL3_BH24CHL3_09340 [soil metagenome]|nr:hypothetical protein [Chloroflexia bacterium]